MDEALVRTGIGGPKVSIAGAMVVLPLVHKFSRVTLRTLKLDVKTGSFDKDGNYQGTERGMGVLRSKDMLPLILDAEVYVRIPPKTDYVLNAARTLGRKADPKAMKLSQRSAGSGTETFESLAAEEIAGMASEKLRSAIRSVVATMSLQELHQDRQKLINRISEILETELQDNGLELETVTVESLDQEPISRIKARSTDSVFDARAYRSLVEAQETNLTETNQIERTQGATRLGQDTEFEKQRLTLEKERQVAAEEQERDIANQTVKLRAETAAFEADTELTKTEKVEAALLAANKFIEQTAQDLEIFQNECERNKLVTAANYEKEFETAALERDRTIELLEVDVQQNVEQAQIEKTKNIGLSGQEAKKEVGVSRENSEAAVLVANVAKSEQINVRKEQEKLAIVQQEKGVEASRIETLKVRAEAEDAESKVETAREEERLRRELVVPAEKKAEQAEIEKREAIIEAEASKEQERVSSEAKKLKVVLQAEADRDASIATAEGKRQEVRLIADGDREAAILLSEGIKAKGEAATAELEFGRATAAALKARNEADVIAAEARLLNEKTIVPYYLAKNSDQLASHLTSAVEAAFKPLESIEGMRILQVNTDGGEGSNGSPMASILKNLAQIAPAGAILNDLLDMSGSDKKVSDIVSDATKGISDLLGENKATED
ncbi:SPFH domain-containing protein [bacterium]|nr:SPFH domain-containing protein [bacterium]